MSVHAAYFTQDGVKQTITQVSQWGSCWAYFSAPNRNYNPKGGKTELFILVTLEHNKWACAKAFIESGFFKRLTNDTVTISEWGVGTFNGERIKGGMESQNLVIIKADPELGASRFITAMRLLTYINKCGPLDHIDKELYRFVPFAYNARAVRGCTYSDNAITLAPITAAMVVEAYRAGDEETFEDLYMEHVLQEFSLQGDPADDDDDYDDDDFHANVPRELKIDAAISHEMLARIWNRSSEEFDRRSHQNESVLKRGYWKDDACNQKIDIHGENDYIVTISAPITDRILEGEQPIGDVNLKEICVALSQNEIK